MRLFRFAAFACVLTVGSATAQRKPAAKPAPAKPAPRHESGAKSAQTRWPIERMSVEGNNNFTDDQILAVAGLKVGQLAGKEEFEAARDRLIASGAFESVGYRFEPASGGKGFAASFQVVEVTPGYPVRFQDFSAPESELRAHLKSRDPLFGPKVPGTQPFLERYSKALTEKIGERVAARVVATGPDEFEILFRPARPIPAVAQVIFEGNKVIPTPLLNEKIGGVAFGATYTEERFRQLLENSIRPLYEARGRIRVQFPKISTTPAPGDVKGLVVTVQVDEGESYSLGEVKLAGAPEELLKIAKIHTGDVANFDEVNEGVSRIRQSLARSGYLKPQIRVNRSLNDEKKIVDVTLEVDRGPHYRFGKLTIEGLDILSEPAVRRMWALKEGDPYNAEYPQAVLQRIQETRMFDNLGKTGSTVQVNEESHTVDVTLKFAGEPPPEKKPRF
jgi:outer membrane protein insertion porin family